MDVSNQPPTNAPTGRAAPAAPPPLPVGIAPSDDAVIPYASPATGFSGGAPPAAPASPHGPQPPVFLPVHWLALAAAQIRAKSIRTVISWSSINAWITAIFAGLTVLFGISSISGWLLGGGMAVVAWNEFRGGRQLRQLRPAACRILGFNQLAFGGLLAAFALWQINGLMTNPGAVASELAAANIDSRTMGSFASVDQLVALLGYVTYGVLLAVAIFGCGGTAIYYFTRRKIIDAYIAETAPWIVQLQKALNCI